MGARLVVRLLGVAVEFGRRGLIKPSGFFHAQDADRFEDPQCAECIRVCGVLRGLKADLDMALRGEIVDFVGLYFLDKPDQVGCIGQIAVVK